MRDCRHGGDATEGPCVAAVGHGLAAGRIEVAGEILWSSKPQVGVATASSPQLLPRSTLTAKPFAADHAILPALPARRA